jgi:hypothetical protein
MSCSLTAKIVVSIPNYCHMVTESLCSYRGT